MRRIVHLSDLHFGRVDPALVEPLVAEVERLAPHVVVVSGDLTQRATRAQYQEAAAFLRRLPRPQVVVPGNHDISLWNVLRRFRRPLDRWRRHVGEEVEPWFEDGELVVLGVNTARSLTWKGGRVSVAQVERLRARLAAAPGGAFRVVASHHPLLVPEGAGQGAAAGRAGLALAALEAAGTDVLLAGHLHAGSVRSSAAELPKATRAMLLVQAGTTLSVRTRRERQSFNVLDLEGHEVSVSRRVWAPSRGGFEERPPARYRKRGAWEPVPEGPGSAPA